LIDESLNPELLLAGGIPAVAVAVAGVFTGHKNETIK
jgi:hypothetical protein